MILSKELMFSDDQDLAQTAAAYASTNHVDMGAPGTPHGAAAAINRDIAKGEPVPIDIMITETFASGGAATLTIELQTDDDPAFGSATTIWSSGALALAALVQGYRIPPLYLPEGITERYMRVLYTIGTATTTAGKVTAALASGGRQTNQ